MLRTLVRMIPIACRCMGETPNELYHRIASQNPPGKDNLIHYVRRELWKATTHLEKTGSHNIAGPMPLHTCMAAFRPYGVFVRQFVPKVQEHILSITDQTRLMQFCSFQVRCMPCTCVFSFLNALHVYDTRFVLAGIASRGHRLPGYRFCAFREFWRILDVGVYAV